MLAAFSKGQALGNREFDAVFTVLGTNDIPKLTARAARWLEDAVTKVIKGLKGEHTVLVSSHILGEISQVCDRYLVIQGGELIAQGTEAQLSDKLGSGGPIEIDCVGQAGPVIELLKKVDGVIDITMVKLDGQNLSLHVDAKNEIRPALVKALVQADVPVIRVDRAAHRLENIFLKLTHGKDA